MMKDEIPGERERGEEITIRVKVPRSQLAFFVATIESYEELGVVRITHPKEARAEIYAPVHSRETLLQLFDSFYQEGILVKFLKAP